MRSQFETISSAKIYKYSLNIKFTPKPHPNPIRQKRKNHHKKILKFHIEVGQNFSISRFQHQLRHKFYLPFFIKDFNLFLEPKIGIFQKSISVTYMFQMSSYYF